MKCTICWRERLDQGDYCQYHQAALDNIKSRFDNWKKAMGTLTWNEYVKLLVDAPGVGEWAQNVAEHMLKEIKKNGTKKPKK